MKITTDIGNVLIDNKKKTIQIYDDVVSYEDFDAFIQTERFEAITGDPEYLAWLMGKPRPSPIALTIVYLMQNSKKVEFSAQEYEKTISPKQFDVDFAFIKKNSKYADIITKDPKWDIKFLPIDCEQDLVSNKAYVTYFSGRYALGVIGLIRSLRKFTNTKLIILHNKGEITTIFDKFKEELNIDLIEIEPVKNPNTHGQERFKDTYNKLRIFDLINYNKLIYIDADCLVLKDIEHLFSIKAEIAACPDWGINYAQGFNSGLIVFTPSLPLRDYIWNNYEKGIHSDDGGDQGFLNKIFKDKIKYLPPKYNTLKRVYDQRSSVFSISNIFVLHYVGVKPWEVLQFEPKYEHLNNIWLETLEKQDLITLHKFNKVYASRRIQNLKKKLEDENKKNANKKNKSDAISLVKKSQASTLNVKKKSYTKSVLMWLWNRLP